MSKKPNAPTLRLFRDLLAINQSLFSRQALISAGSIDGDGRDLDTSCGYPSSPSMGDYSNQYDRNGCASRVVDVYPDETWAVAPEIYENENPSTTAFERDVSELIERINLWHFMHRADRLSGIRRFGLMFLGFGDGRETEVPLDGIDLKTGKRKEGSTAKHELLFVRILPESAVTVAEMENDVTNPRFGQPTMYQIQFSMPDAVASMGVNVTQTNVHWTRVIHFADNREESEIFGKPRLRPVYNYVFDVRKILGGSGEMFWKGGFPGLSIETQPGLEEV